ncbi:dUTP diphosphatase [Psychrobacillus sp. OK032]|uniref:dUTP diphosphatase n=1 Tax=Psychrobacillus sp. OK032 TaxID=1884358 RepID=UPI0008CAFF9C|nr:dUTP diphosphatase [Psychrobacillus sp. OK032]SER89861.1 Dimeric dUTPase, all-alpha-NTP-PPase (MazG) superfamily [Psychrobacillus sp. OK032]
MNLEKLFTMQAALDEYIQSNKQVDEDVFMKKGLALVVELAELANETRCFKFWSGKGPSERAVILEEYVDSIHFLLSLGITRGLDDLKEWPIEKNEEDLTTLFLLTNEAIIAFLHHSTKITYEKIWVLYGAIAEKLGFSSEDVLKAYISKNETNYERQKSGY